MIEVGEARAVHAQGARTMNGSTENMAHGSFEKPGRQATLLNLATARKMVPLVQRIVEDVLRSQQTIATLLPERSRLDRHRRDLSWPERARRYRLQEEMAAAERQRDEAVAELAHLGLALVDPAEGRVGFPTVVNSRPAYFSWCPGEVAIHFWHFPGESVRRPIPASWAKSANIRLSLKD